MTRRTALPLSAALLSLMLPATLAAQELTIGLGSEITSIDPHFHNQNPNGNVSAHIFDRLISRDARQNLAPGLAESWQMLDPLTWEFTLRKGVKFHDGSDFDAEDVIASIRRVPDVPNSPSSFAKQVSAIDSMEAVDPHTLRITTKTPWPLLAQDLSLIFIISDGEAAASTADFNAGTAAIGTGPFRFGDYTRGERLRLLRNDAYWGDAPEWESVLMRFIVNDAARVAAVLSGDVMVIDKVPTVDLPRLEATAGLAVHSTASSRLVYLYADQLRDQSPFVKAKDGSDLPGNPLKDVRVREALSAAIDRSAIAARIFNGQAVPAGDILPTGTEGVNGFDPEPFDADHARALLAEAGYGDGFALTLHVPSDRYPGADRAVQAVASMLHRVGIAAEVDAQPWANYVAQASAPNYAYSVFVGSWGGGTGEASDTLRSVIATYDKDAGVGTANRGRYSNADVDARIAAAMASTDAAERAQLLKEAGAIAMEDHAIIPLYFQSNAWVSKDGLTYVPRADEFTLAIDVRSKTN